MSLEEDSVTSSECSSEELSEDTILARVGHALFGRQELRQRKAAMRAKKKTSKKPAIPELVNVQDPDSCPQQLMKSLMKMEHVWHVASYVITDTGKLVIQNRRFTAIRPIFLQSFGGCNYPNNIVRMLNSVRLELMDESSVLLTEEKLIAASPPYLLPGEPDAVLVQLFLVREATLGTLWSAERARDRLGKKNVPDAAGLMTNFDAKKRAMGEIIELIPLDDPRLLIAKNWRACDFASFSQLHPAMLRLCRDQQAPRRLELLPPLPRTPKDVWKALLALQELYNADELEALRAAATSPWLPLLWGTADPLFRPQA